MLLSGVESRYRSNPRYGVLQEIQCVVSGQHTSVDIHFDGVGSRRGATTHRQNVYFGLVDESEVERSDCVESNRRIQRVGVNDESACDFSAAIGGLFIERRYMESSLPVVIGVEVCGSGYRRIDIRLRIEGITARGDIGSRVVEFSVVVYSGQVFVGERVCVYRSIELDSPYERLQSDCRAKLSTPFGRGGRFGAPQQPESRVCGVGLARDAPNAVDRQVWQFATDKAE